MLPLALVFLPQATPILTKNLLLDLKKYSIIRKKALTKAAKVERLPYLNNDIERLRSEQNNFNQLFFTGLHAIKQLSPDLQKAQANDMAAAAANGGNSNLAGGVTPGGTLMQYVMRKLW